MNIILLYALLLLKDKFQYSDAAISSISTLENSTQKPENIRIPSCMVKDGVRGMFTFEGFSPCSLYCTPGKWIHVLCKLCCIRKSGKSEYVSYRDGNLSPVPPPVPMAMAAKVHGQLLVLKIEPERIVQGKILNKNKEGKKQKGKVHGPPKKSKDGLMFVGIGAVALILVPGLIWVGLKLTRTDNPRNPEIGLELLRLNREDGDDDAGQEANAAGQDKVKDQNDANEGPQAEGRDEAEDQDEAEDRDEVEDWGDAEDQDEAANGNGEQNADAGQNEADENNGNGGLFHAVPRDNAVEHSEPTPHQATN